MLPRKQTGGALIIGADLALCQFMQQKPARFVQGLGSNDLATQIAKIDQPLAKVQRQLLVQLFPELLGERRRVPGGRDCDLQVPAADDGREVEVAEGRIVDCIA
jgi:hypothetical protein